MFQAVYSNSVQLAAVFTSVASSTLGRYVFTLAGTARRPVENSSIIWLIRSNIVSASALALAQVVEPDFVSLAHVAPSWRLRGDDRLPPVSS